MEPSNIAFNTVIHELNQFHEKKSKISCSSEKPVTQIFHSFIMEKLESEEEILQHSEECIKKITDKIKQESKSIHVLPFLRVVGLWLISPLFLVPPFGILLVDVFANYAFNVKTNTEIECRKQLGKLQKQLEVISRTPISAEVHMDKQNVDVTMYENVFYSSVESVKNTSTQDTELNMRAESEQINFHDQAKAKINQAFNQIKKNFAEVDIQWRNR